MFPPKKNTVKHAHFRILHGTAFHRHVGDNEQVVSFGDEAANPTKKAATNEDGNAAALAGKKSAGRGANADAFSKMLEKLNHSLFGDQKKAKKKSTDGTWNPGTAGSKNRPTIHASNGPVLFRMATRAYHGSKRAAPNRIYGLQLGRAPASK